jgi:hypothetical protein
VGEVARAPGRTRCEARALMGNARGASTGGRAVAGGVAAACVALAAATLLLPASPSFDPWAWIVWGREVLQGDLVTETGPSWKPLPVLFTAPFSLFGDAAPALWTVVARAATFGAVAAAASIGFRLAGRPGGALAGGLLLAAPWLWETSGLANSEGAVILCVLGAFDRHLARRHGQAFAFGVAAGLLRPEAWPFLALYGLWLVVRERGRMAWVALGLVALPALWLLPELWGSGSLWRAADRAQAVGADSPALAERPALAVLENAAGLMSSVVALGLVAGVAALAAGTVTRQRAVMAGGLAALGAAWLVMVMAMTEAGFSGHQRYLMPAAGAAHVLAGIGLAWAFGALVSARRRTALAVAAATVLTLAGLVGAWRVLLQWPHTLRVLERHGVVIGDLGAAVERAGGVAAIRDCGQVYTSPYLESAVAWEVERHLDEVTWTPDPRPPGTLLRARLIVDRPLEPPRGALSANVARTRHWEIEAACDGGSG